MFCYEFFSLKSSRSLESPRCGKSSLIIGKVHFCEDVSNICGALREEKEDGSIRRREGSDLPEEDAAAASSDAAGPGGADRPLRSLPAVLPLLFLHPAGQSRFTYFIESYLTARSL